MHIKVAKITTLVAVLVSLLVVGWYWFSMNQADRNYSIYKSENPALDFTLRYPNDWKVAEMRGRDKPYDAVQFIGERDPENLFSVGFAITARAENPPSNTDPLADFLKHMEGSPDFKLISTKKRMVGQRKTKVATYEYILHLPPLKTDAKDVLMKEMTLFVKKDRKSYRISFLGTAEQFEENEAVFNHVLKTFQFTQ